MLLLFYFCLVIFHVCVCLQSPTIGIKNLRIQARERNSKRQESEDWHVWNGSDFKFWRCRLRIICIRRSCTNLCLRIKQELCLGKIGVSGSTGFGRRQINIGEECCLQYYQWKDDIWFDKGNTKHVWKSIDIKQGILDSIVS